MVTLHQISTVHVCMQNAYTVQAVLTATTHFMGKAKFRHSTKSKTREKNFGTVQLRLQSAICLQTKFCDNGDQWGPGSTGNMKCTNFDIRPLFIGTAFSSTNRDFCPCPKTPEIEPFLMQTVFHSILHSTLPY